MSQDQLRLPPEWKEAILPRWPDSDFVAETVSHNFEEAFAVNLDRFLGREQSPLSEPVASGLSAYKDRATQATPEQGAQALLVLSFEPKENHQTLRDFLDLLVQEHGPRFTTEAVLRAVRLSERLYKDYRGRPNPTNGWEDPALYRLRRHLAASTEVVYQDCLQCAAEIREEAGQKIRAATCALFPTEQEWVESDAHLNHDEMRWLLTAVDSAGLAGKLLRPIILWRLKDAGLEILATFVSSVGPELGEALIPIFEEPFGSIDSKVKELLAAILSQLPTDRALEWLVRYSFHKSFGLAALKTVQKYPQRAQRLLANRGPEDFFYRLAHPTAGPKAMPSSWPKVLQDETWETRKSVKFKPLALEPLPFEPSMNWGIEKKRWRRIKNHVSLDWDLTWKSAQGGSDGSISSYLAFAPDIEKARELAAKWKPEKAYHFFEHFRPAAARLELDLLELLVRFSRQDPKSALPVMIPFGDPSLAPVVAQGLAKLKNSRVYAREWLRRHPKAASVGLLPMFVAKGKERDWATESLRYLCDLDHFELVSQTAQQYGEEVVQRVQLELAEDAGLRLPKKLPKRPEEIHLAALPPLVLKQGGELPQQAVERVLTLLALSTPGRFNRALHEVQKACTQESLDAFSWGLFQNWLILGGPAKHSWAVLSIGWFGSQALLEKLLPYFAQWPKEGASARAANALEVFKASQSAAALRHLYRLGQESRSQSLRKKALSRLQEIADERGLSSEQLADMLVDDLGLDQDGCLSLEDGENQYRISLSEKLEPLLGAQAKAIKALPRFKAFKKALKAVVTSQRHRLELALRMQRRWSSGDFELYFMKHPLNLQFARRLLWGCWQGGRLVQTFRVAEDGTLADVKDENFSLPGVGELGLFHPIQGSKDLLQEWSRVMGDYELLPPFEQLQRDTFMPPPDKEQGTDLAWLLGLETDDKFWFSLERRGWLKQSDSHSQHVLYTLESSQATLLVVEIQRGAKCLIRSATFSELLGQVEPVFYSECLRDLNQSLV